MSKKISQLIKLIGIYFVQVAALWGILEAYTYFKGDDLKEFLGPFWVLIYILPLFTTGYVMWHGIHEAQKPQETLTTKGNYSPGKVGGNYFVGTEQNQEDISNTQSTGTAPSQEVPKATETITTQGDYSPGKVEKNYSVKTSTASTQSPSSSEHQNETSQDNEKADVEIHTKGNFSPGKVGGNYTVDIE